MLCPIELRAGLGDLSLLCRPSSCSPTFLHHFRDAFPGCGAHLAPASLLCTCSPRSLGAGTVAAQRLKRGDRALNSSFFSPQISYQSCSIHLLFSFLTLRNKIHCQQPRKPARKCSGGRHSALEEFGRPTDDPGVSSSMLVQVALTPSSTSREI